MFIYDQNIFPERYFDKSMLYERQKSKRFYE